VTQEAVKNATVKLLAFPASLVYSTSCQPTDNTAAISDYQFTPQAEETQHLLVSHHSLQSG